MHLFTTLVRFDPMYNKKNLVLALALALACGAASGRSDPYAGLAPPEGVGVGIMPRVERSPYRDAGTRFDLQPLYLYEGEQFYIRSQSIGLKFGGPGTGRSEVFLRHRFESHPSDDIPASLAGMSRREQGIDGGIATQVEGAWGIGYAELLRDLSTASRGTEFRLGYKLPWRRGRLYVVPHAVVAFRNARLNDYYYGVRPEEATPERGAYRAGTGVMPEVGVQAAYRFTGRWWLLAGASVARLPQTVADSPIIEHRTTRSLTLGVMYDLSPEYQAWPEGRPLIGRIFYGASSDCDVMPIATLQCTSVHTQDKTGVVGFELGRPFIERLNGWPLDLAGFLGLIRHTERGFQPDFWQINAYFKAYFYGFPWDARVRTRLGLGAGLSYANRIPFAEQRDLATRGRSTSKLLQSLDPTIDVSVGDLFGVRRLRETYAGVGVSHRSGIFGTSQLLGNVNGGSNYIYGYLETTF
jgi:MipA family protein